MNTYLIPVALKTEVIPEIYNKILFVYANSENEAWTKAICEIGSKYIIQDYKFNSYEYYENELKVSSHLIYYYQKYDIIKEAFSLTNIKEEIYMDIYEYMYWGDYNNQIQKLAEKALPEKWSFEGRNDNSILKNYLKYTFKNLQNEGKIIETDNYCVFNTGLFTNYYSPIYVYGEPNLNQDNENNSKWFFKGFKDEYELGNMDIESDFPERADYFSDPNRLVFNWHYKINVNYNHILDNLNTSIRLPDCIKNSSTPLETLTGVINKSIQKVIANYKLAVPHYYQNKIQLLIPLYFGENESPSVALVLDLKKNGYYQAATCLSMEMAYTDARIIAKPESNWLMADNIIGESSENEDI